VAPVGKWTAFISMQYAASGDKTGGFDLNDNTGPFVGLVKVEPLMAMVAND
jgi:hypothetical protein